MSHLTYPKLEIRVYESQVDDSGKPRWFAEAGRPVGLSDGWIIFAEAPLSSATRQEALDSLNMVLWGRYRMSEQGIRALLHMADSERWTRLANRIRSLWSRAPKAKVSP